jgi:hypothetical protein
MKPILFTFALLPRRSGRSPRSEGYRDRPAFAVKNVVDWSPLIVAAIAFATGCAHGNPDPFIYAPADLERERATPPTCFSAALAGCVNDPTQREPIDHLASPWNEHFEPDLAHRICRGDDQARSRWLDGARQIAEDDPRERLYLEFLGPCPAPDFCAWTIGNAGNDFEPLPTRRLLFESARRWCDEVLDTDTLAIVGSTLGRSIADDPAWNTSSRQTRCAGTARHEDPWRDLAGLHSAGCLDLGEWIERHRDDVNATAAALGRCAEGREIRYQEANCLRELAGLDRQRAVALVRADDRRGWGISSTITRYARILLRFPEEGQLETELARLGLLPAGLSPGGVSGYAPVLPEEVLERHGRLADFNPGCSVRYCEHAPLMYQLIDLASPVLDDVVLEERWPALETLDLGSGPRSVSISIDGIPFPLQVAEMEDGRFDRDEYDLLVTAIKSARKEPHVLTAYSRRRAYRLHIRNLGEWHDLDALLGGLNTLLADRGSDLRYAALDPHCVPCARVVAGPGNGLIDAAFAGLIEAADPFKLLWTQRSFEAQKAQQ